MSFRSFADDWRQVLDSIGTAAGGGDAASPPIVLSSLPDMPYAHEARAALAPLSFIHGPPGRNIALAIGLRAAMPRTPLVLVMSADSVSLGTNHLIHAARRNIGMTLLILRSDLLADGDRNAQDRAGWDLPSYQRQLESPSRPLDWAAALGASLVGRANLDHPGELAAIIRRALAAPGFSVIGVTADLDLATGVLNEHPWPEYFDAYREWAMPLRRAGSGSEFAHRMPAAPMRRTVPRYEVRIAGLGGHGVKLAGTVLSEAAGFHEGLWATQRGDYGSATRGGPSTVDVVMGSDPITYPGADHPDALVVLTQGAADRYAGDMKPGARMIADPAEVTRMPPGALAVPITALAREHTGQPLAAGVVALGCVAALSDAISTDSLHRSLGSHVPPRVIERNLAACAAGYSATRAALAGTAASIGGQHG